MKTFLNAHHHLHSGRHEMFRGQLVACHEVPARLEHVLAELRRRPLGPLVVPDEPADLDRTLARVHTPEYLAFLAGAWDEWVALAPENAGHDVLPSVWPGRGLRQDVVPGNFAARLGHYAFDAGTPLTAGTWHAARAGAGCAVAGARALLGDASLHGARSSVFVLTRPPGHHASADMLGGYCFLNNSALAAQVLRDGGVDRVGILDIDYHHGNGTQDIFRARNDVFTVSIHGDPSTEYPFYLGYADERGEGAGMGFNLNLPLPRGTAFPAWRDALMHGLATLADFDARALVVPLGVDTFAGDPISGFRLATDDYREVGRALARLDVPTVFVFEGGYAVEEVGVNVVHVLEGHASA